jgi:hypothetical protein
MKLKIFAIILILILIVNLILFALKSVNPLIFWIILILTAIIAYKIMPKLRK